MLDILRFCPNIRTLFTDLDLFGGPALALIQERSFHYTRMPLRKLVHCGRFSTHLSDSALSWGRLFEEAQGQGHNWDFEMGFSILGWDEIKSQLEKPGRPQDGLLPELNIARWICKSLLKRAEQSLMKGFRIVDMYGRTVDEARAC